jgi:lipoic acid synthetase/lipoate-protein ligase A
MLFDTDMQHMLNAITPPQTKLDKHGVESVRQRITLLKEHTDLSIEAFKEHTIRKLCDKELKLTAEDVKGIETIEQEYLNPIFIYGKENMSL